MKKLFTLFLLVVGGQLIKAQTTGTIAIQFYIDANNNCIYNAGEQLVYGVPCQLQYLNNSSNVMYASNTNTFLTCNASTFALSSPSLTPTNTLSIMAGFGIAANTSCGLYNNIAFNSNTIKYIPVLLPNNNAGVGTPFVQYFSSTGNVSYSNLTGTNNAIGLCSNYGNDSLRISFNVSNYLSCTSSNTMSSRSYSLYFDGVNYDVINVNVSAPANTNTTGVNNMSNASEGYYAQGSFMSFYPKLPSTFTALGSHTFEIKSSLIYNYPQSTITFSCIFNAIPCTKVSGRFYNDCNYNCLFDGTDTYGVGNYVTGKVYNSAINFTTTFSPNPVDGKFSVYLPTTNSYSLTQYPSNIGTLLSFTPCSTSTITIPPASTTNTFLFGYKSNQINTSDPGVYLSRLSSTSPSVNPGSGATYAVYFSNYYYVLCSNAAANPGKLKITLPKFVSYVSMVNGPAPTISIGTNVDTLIWNVPNFSISTSYWTNPFGTFSIAVSNTAVAGNTMTIHSMIIPANDLYLTNNSWSLTRLVGGPYDPNGKYTEAKGLMANGDVPANTTQFYYTIGFQNVGTAPAINVKTADTIDVNFDLNSLEVLQSSYPVSIQKDLVSRLVIFNFNGINLPDATSDEPKSHGFVKYGIKLKPGVPVNTVLKNRAHNYFDFNAPVATNQTINKLVVPDGIENNTFKQIGITARPNPFAEQLTLSAEAEIQQIEVYDQLGRLQKSLSTNGKEQQIDFSNLNSGIYFIRVQLSDGRSGNVKVIKN